MTVIPYYPGCTLSTKAQGYDRSGRAVARALGLELQELDDWQCCGATFPLTLDDSMALIAPTRVLYQAQQAGERLATLCAICFHVLRRSQALLQRDPTMLERINWFTGQEYRGVRVVHFLEILRDEIGWDALAAKVVRPLTSPHPTPRPPPLSQDWEREGTGGEVRASTSRLTTAACSCALMTKSAWTIPKARPSCTT